jgi:RNA polymerase sigma-70 factor (ECF subfamily)
MNQVYMELDHHVPHMKRYALSLCRNKSDAEDLVQECAARALDKSGKFQPGTNLRAWLLTMMHNLHISQVRKTGSSAYAVDTESVPSAVAELPRQISHIALRELSEAMRHLPALQRKTLEMAALDGRGYDDIAVSQDVSVGTIKSRVARGRQALRDLLEGEIRAADFPDPGARQDSPSISTH